MRRSFVDRFPHEQGTACKLNGAAGVILDAVKVTLAEFDGLSRREATLPVMLKSGDVIVMGGPSRLRYHGIREYCPASHRRAQGRDDSTSPSGNGETRVNCKR